MPRGVDSASTRSPYRDAECFANASCACRLNTSQASQLKTLIALHGRLSR